MPPFSRRATCGTCALLLGDVRDQGFGRQQQRGDRAGVLKRRAHHLRRVDDARLDEVLIRFVLRVKSLVSPAGVSHLLHHDRPLEAGVLRDPPHRLLKGPAEDVDAYLLAVVDVERVERFDSAQQGHTASGHDPFLDRRLRGVHRVLDPSLLLLHLYIPLRISTTGRQQKCPYCAGWVASDRRVCRHCGAILQSGWG